MRRQGKTYIDLGLGPLYTMAENIYSKGTRVWFEDKEQAWLSAEVTQVTKGTDDSIKLVFVDERGKVRSGRNGVGHAFLNHPITGNYP
jgi:hypothetical protein